jgi:hypothetical protein
MEFLAVGGTGSCITPILAKKAIDFVNFLKTGTAVTDEVRNFKIPFLSSVYLIGCGFISSQMVQGGNERASNCTI